MRFFPRWLVFAVLAALFWGSYGTAAKASGMAFHHASELTFLYVCLAYTMIGIPWTLSRMSSDHGGHWTAGCRNWGIGAGNVGALGALFVILAIKSGASPLVVMPLVFGLSQGFNFGFTWAFGKFKLPRTPNFKFYLSFPAMIACTWAVQQFKPGAPGAAVNMDFGIWMVFTLLAAICWGLYGVCARTAVMKSKLSPSDHGSHIKPLFWVSLVYAAYGMLTLAFLLGVDGFEKHTIAGASLGFLVGVCGLVGAGFVIPANSVQGSPGPGTVMAVVFATASVVNAITSWIAFPPEHAPAIWFWAALAGLIGTAYIFARNNPTVPMPKPKLAAGT